MPDAQMLQALDVETGHIELLSSAGEGCLWPTGRMAVSLVTWQERFLIMFGGLVRPGDRLTVQQIC